jgi:ribosomal protein L11 methyltransferase
MDQILLGGEVQEQRTGCGSGILAVAALKLGARAALGVDNDSQALAASRNNAASNRLPPGSLAVALPGEVDREAWAGRADVVVANILAAPLMELAPALVEFLRPGGALLLSGLLQSQAQTLCRHYEPLLPLAVSGEQAGWVRLEGTLAKH